MCSYFTISINGGTLLTDVDLGLLHHKLCLQLYPIESRNFLPKSQLIYLFIYLFLSGWKITKEGSNQVEANSTYQANKGVHKLKYILPI